MEDVVPLLCSLFCNLISCVPMDYDVLPILVQGWENNKAFEVQTKPNRSKVSAKTQHRYYIRLCSNLITAVKNSCLLARESRFYRAWPPVELYNQSVINEMR